MPKPRYIKGKITHSNYDYQKKEQNTNFIPKYTTKPTHVSSLINRLTPKEKFKLNDKLFSIKDYRFKTASDLTTENLSKVGFEQTLNFVFSKEDLKNMLECKKVIIRENALQSNFNDEEYFINRFYLVPLDIQDNELPIIYRFTTQRNASNDYYSITMQGVVGGAIDGSFNLFRIDSPHIIKGRYETYKIETPHIHQAKPESENPKKMERIKYTALDENLDMLSAINLVMKNANIVAIGNTNESNIEKMIKILQKTLSKDVLIPVDAQYIFNKITSEGIERVDLREFKRTKEKDGITIGDIPLSLK